MTRRHMVTLVCASAVLAGCGGTSTGSPTPTEPAETPTQPTNVRPREIRLDGKDPCSLIPRSDWENFSIERPGKPQENGTFKSPECYYGSNIGGARVTLVMTEGIEAWTAGGRNVDVLDAAPVEGFPAISIDSRGDDRRCDAIVDVAEGQYLLAATMLAPEDEPRVGGKCEFSYRLAESAMKTLVEL